MPVPNVAASPVASISPPAVPASAAAAASEGQSNSPFAATLQQQMTGQQKADSGAATENTAAVPDTGQAAPLPMLLGSELAEWLAANLTQGKGAKAAQDQEAQASTPVDPVLGLLAVPVAGTQVVANALADSAAPATGGASTAADMLKVIALTVKAEAGATDTDVETLAAEGSRSGDFAAIVEAMGKSARGGAPTAVPAAVAMAESPANVAVSAETIAATAKPDTGQTINAETAVGNRDPNLLAAAAALTQASTPSRATTGSHRIDTPVGAAGWHNEIGDHVAWMANHQHGRAELVLTPPQFGRIEISLSVTGDQANAFFISANPAVRETLESALPRLREILADAGITLGQAHVGSESSGQSAEKRENSDNSWRGSATGAMGDGVASTRVGTHAINPWNTTGRGMVDIFA